MPTAEGLPSAARARVLLIFPPSLYLNYTPPLNLAYIAAVLEQAGCSVSIIDASSLHGVRATNQIVQAAKDIKPDVIGLTLNVLFLFPAYELARQLKRQWPHVPLIAGGPHPSLLAHEALEIGFDFVVRGEGERTIVELLQVIEHGASPEKVSGVSYLHDGVTHDNPNRPLIADLDELPFPAKHLFARREYVADSDYYQAFGPIFSGRGCPARCTYCYKGVFGASVRVRSAENVLAEMVSLNQTYGVTAFEFMDDSFSVIPSRVERLCDLLLEGNFKFKWQCTTRLDFTTPRLLQKMHEAGCFRVFYGFETGDPQTLSRIKKRLNIEQAVQVLKWTHETGIKSIVGFMYGFPWETAEQVRNTTKVIKRLRAYVDEFNPLGIMIPVPGTEIYHEFAAQYGLERWWLEAKFGHRYRSNTYFPYFRRRFYNDFALLEDGFFPFPSDVKRAIIKGTRVIGTHNIFHNIRFPLNIVVYSLVHLSIALYALSPELEHRAFTVAAAFKELLRKLFKRHQ